MKNGRARGEKRKQHPVCEPSPHLTLAKQPETSSLQESLLLGVKLRVNDQLVELCRHLVAGLWACLWGTVVISLMLVGRPTHHFPALGCWTVVRRGK